MQTITIKQIPNEFAESIGLDKHNRSRLPGTAERLQVAENADGRFLTGLDEKSYLIKGGETSELGQKIKAKRERLEKATGKDLSGTSDFWHSYYITIPSDSDLVLNADNAMHEVAYNALVANKYIAPSKEDISNPVYKDANYYGFTQESEVQEEVASNKLRDKAVGLLSTIDTNVNKMALVGQYLEGNKYAAKLGENTLYKMLREYINQKDLKFAKLFIKALDMSTEDMQRKIIIDKAFKTRIIKSVKIAPKKNVYQFGQATLGGSVEEVYTYLSDPQNSNDLIAIQNELKD